MRSKTVAPVSKQTCQDEPRDESCFAGQSLPCALLRTELKRPNTWRRVCCNSMVHNGAAPSQTAIIGPVKAAVTSSSSPRQLTSPRGHVGHPTGAGAVQQREQAEVKGTAQQHSKPLHPNFSLQCTIVLTLGCGDAHDAHKVAKLDVWHLALGCRNGREVCAANRPAQTNQCQYCAEQ